MLPFESSRPDFMALLLESIQVATVPILKPTTYLPPTSHLPLTYYLHLPTYYLHTTCRCTSCTASPAGGSTATASCRMLSLSASLAP
eukprot:4138874-Prymnesium_polylepis.1